MKDIKSLIGRPFQSFGGGGTYPQLGSQASKQLGFTLAEMMVVMLIMSIILACMAPAVTTKMKADRNAQTSPWKWANASDIYFGLGSAQTAMLGQREKGVGEDAKLIIHNPTESVQDMILFKQNNNAVGRLRIDGEGLLLGTLSNGSTLPSDSIALGISTNPSISSIAIGSNTTALDNSVVIGVSSAGNAENSVVIGEGASTSDIGGTAVGQGASASNISVALGQGATAGDSSVAIGQGSNAEGTSAIAIGKEAKANKPGVIAIGNYSMSKNNTGDGNTAIGNYSMSENTTGAGNTALGASSLYKNTTGYDNTAIGTWALSTNTTGKNNTALGYRVLQANSTGADNTALGSSSLYYNTTGYNNTALGTSSLYYNTTGYNNTALGTQALYSNTTGSENIAIGYQALSRNTTGNNNTALGTQTLFTSATGSNNTAIGAQACTNVKGPNKTCIGANSGPDAGHSWAAASDSAERIFIGSKSKFNNAPAVLEVHNTGNSVKMHNGAYSGKDASVVINGNLLVKGTIITHTIDRYGNHVSAFQVLERSGTSENNAALKGGLDETTGFDDYFNSTGGGTGWSSDRRLKYVGKENQDGLSKLRQLKIFNYTYKKDEAKIPHVGVIAQDLQKVFPNAVKKGADGFLTIRMEDMFYAVINAIKELDAKYQAQEKRIDELENRIKILETKINFHTK